MMRRTIGLRQASALIRCWCRFGLTFTPRL